MKFTTPLVMTLALSACSWPGDIAPTAGKVVSITTGEPVAGATVTFECSRGRFLHGFETVRARTMMTGPDGTFAISLGDVLGCSFVSLQVDKAGYDHFGHGGAKYVPTQVRLTPDADVVMVRLSSINPTRSIYQSTAARYYAFYAAFFESKRIAKTERERAFVSATYCPAMTQLYAALAEPERAALRGRGVMFAWKSFNGTGTVDHENEVVPYCGAGQ